MLSTARVLNAFVLGGLYSQQIEEDLPLTHNPMKPEILLSRDCHQNQTSRCVCYNLPIFEELDISQKINKYTRAMGIINSVMKPSLVQKHPRIRLYNTLARPMLSYGREAWTLRKADKSRITACEMRFKRRTAGYTKISNIFYGPLEKELRKRVQMCFVWSVVLYGTETRTLRRSEEKRLEALDMWISRRKGRVKWTNRIRNKGVLERVKKERC
ncbi:hypothetical protein ANN_11815 [Periplaneta americana]|uniref:Uncharacterized protein n=1 Tax=Periplaneta americana TaxID=6978 RepID=A0ABQ8T779_PERAM|nr:hypothetical protein ANN_11815 [Periplaneta americana]